MKIFQSLHFVYFLQCGKTFQAIEKIKTEIKQDDNLGRSVHIIYTMNTLLNNHQFAKRLDDIEDEYGQGSICIFNCKGKTKYTHVKELEGLGGKFLMNEIYPRVVVMCSNSKRFEDGLGFIKVLNDNKVKDISRVFCYYDELHKYISSNSTRLKIETIHNLHIVENITAFTASPEKIWKDSGFWSNIKLMKLDNFSDSNYAGCRDMIYNCIDDIFEVPYKKSPGREGSMKDIIHFISSVLRRFPEILGDNTRTFIPAHNYSASHSTIRDLIFELNQNAVAIVINGNDKTLKYKYSGRTKTLPLVPSDNEEVCETISRLVIQHNLVERPIVITGFICVGMGQTLSHKSLGSFTSAIFSHMDIDNDSLYQLFGRITGRMKDWGDKYVQTQVYCTTTIMNRAIVMEECAMNMVKNYNGEEVTQRDYVSPMYEMGEVGISAIENRRSTKPQKEKVDDDHLWDLITDEFDNLAEANSLLKENGCRQKKTFDRDTDGFIKSTTTKSLSRLDYENVVKEIRNWSKKTAFDLKEKNGNKKEKAGRMIVAYRDINDISSDVYIVRIIKRKETKENSNTENVEESISKKETEEPEENIDTENGNESSPKKKTEEPEELANTNNLSQVTDISMEQIDKDFLKGSKPISINIPEPACSHELGQ